MAVTGAIGNFSWLTPNCLVDAPGFESYILRDATFITFLNNLVFITTNSCTYYILTQRVYIRFEYFRQAAT